MSAAAKPCGLYVKRVQVRKCLCLCRALAKEKRLAEGGSSPFAAWLLRARGRALVVAPRFHKPEQLLGPKSPHFTQARERRTELMSKKKSKAYIGIDVSKKLLEVAAHESDYQFRCANKAKAFGELMVELIALRPALIVLEATGGLEIPVVAALHAAGLPVVVVNPR